MPNFPIFDFSGGWNTRKPPVLLASNELSRADNIRLILGGGFARRRGYTHIGNDDSNTSVVTGLAAFSTPTGTKHIVRTKNAKIEYVNASTATWTDITGGLTVTTTGDGKHAFAVFRGELIGTNGTDIPWTWTGTGNAAAITRTIDAGADTIDKAVAITTHRERVVLGDVTATESAVTSRYESVIWPSTAGTADTWTSAPDGKIHIGQGDGDSITCLISVLGYLVVFKQNSLWRVSDHGISATQTVTRVASVGTPSKHGAVNVDGIVYFLSNDGLLYSYDPRQGDSPDAVQELTTPKIGDWNINKLAHQRLPFAHVTYNEKTSEIVCFLDDLDIGATTPAQPAAWVFNVQVGAWTRWFYNKRMNVSIYGWNAISALGPVQPMYGTHDGLVVAADVRAFDNAGLSGVSHTATVHFAPTSCDDPTRVKQWNRAYVFTNSQQHDSTAGAVPAADQVTLYQDVALPTTALTANPLSYTITMPAQAGVTTDEYDSVAEQRLSGHGKWVRFRLVHAAPLHIRVSGILLNYELEGERR